jgi:hypothetical protein
MLPPPMMPPIPDASGSIRFNKNAPMSQWIVFKSFHSEAACGYALTEMQPEDKCVASNDPAIANNKMAGKTAAANAAPPSGSTVPTTGARKTKSN